MLHLAPLPAVALCIAVVISCDGGTGRTARDSGSSARADSAASVPAGAASRAPDSAALVGRWLLAPDARDDAVHATDDEAALRDRFGDANVRRDTIWQAEGEFTMGVVLHADDPRQRLEVQWSDTARRARPELVRAGGADSSRWRVAPGVAIGSSLAELERLNGGPFELSGFEWDYGGTVTSWKGGRLAASLDGRVTVRLRPRDGADPALVRQVLGDSIFPSSHPAMRALEPRVWELLVRPR